MLVLDVLERFCIYYTLFKSKRFQQKERFKEGQQKQVERGGGLMKFLIIKPPLAQGRITECHLGQCSLLNYIFEIHLSPSFFLYLSVSPFFVTLSSSLLLL